MDSVELQRLAQRTRTMREIGIGILFASGILTLFIFIPLTGVAKKSPATPITIATPIAPSAFSRIPIEAKAAVVYDLATKKILYAKNAYAQLPLASLTKLLTMYAAFSEFSPNTPITIPANVTHLSEPHAFHAGQIFALASLARITLTASLNDGAAAIAEATAAQENRTLHETLAGVATALDLTQTYAVDGNGLDMNTAVSGGYGSAIDLARLAGAFVAEAPTVAAATTHRFAQATSTDGIFFRVKNTDPEVNAIPHLLLSKTGYTDLAGGNLALVFDVGIGHPVAIVVLGSSLKARFTDGMALVDATLAHFAGMPSL